MYFKLGRLVCEFFKSSGWRMWCRILVVLVFKKIRLMDYVVVVILDV